MRSHEPITLWRSLASKPSTNPTTLLLSPDPLSRFASLIAHCSTQVKLEALEADLESDNPWERVVKLVDLQQEGEGSDVSRMRSILIQLKNEPIKA